MGGRASRAGRGCARAGARPRKGGAGGGRGMAFLGLGRVPLHVSVALDGPEGGGERPVVEVKEHPGQQLGGVGAGGNGQATTELPLYTSGETVSGEIKLEPLTAKRVDYVGVRVELLGQVELMFDRGQSSDFLAKRRELEGAGELLQSPKTYRFEFKDVDMPHESYNGLNARVKYFVRVTVVRSFASNAVQEVPFWLRNVTAPPDANSTIKMEVGIEDCLHIEFEYDKSKYHLSDSLSGSINFLLVRIKLKHMELEVRQRETTTSGVKGQNAFSETQTIVKYEIMDGAPVKAEKIPLRLFLKPYTNSITPTYRNVCNKLDVRYFINLVLVDEEDRRYFKQQEIELYRDKFL